MLSPPPSRRPAHAEHRDHRRRLPAIPARPGRDHAGAVTPVDAVALLAIVPAGSAAPVAFTAAEWAIPGLELRLLVGPGSAYGALAVGDYDVWVKLTTGPEVIIRRAARGLKVV